MYHDHIDHRLDIYTSDLTSCHETTFGAKLRSFLKRTNRTRRFAKKYVARSEESVQICMHLVLSMDHGCTTLMMKTLSTLIIYIICCIRILDAQNIKGPWFWYTPKYAYMYIYIYIFFFVFTTFLVQFKRFVPAKVNANGQAKLLFNLNEVDNSTAVIGTQHWSNSPIAMGFLGGGNSNILFSPRKSGELIQFD